MYGKSKESQKARSPGVKVVDRGPKWGAKRGYKISGSGRQVRTPNEGTPLQMTRQFNAFELSVRSFTISEIARLLHCTPSTVSTDISFEYERRKPIFASGRDEFIKKAFYALESVRQMNFEVLTAVGGLSKTGHEYKSIIAAIALQARLMGYEAPRRFDARIEGAIDHTVLGLPELARQLPDEFTTRLLYAIADAAGFGGDARLDSAAGDFGPVAISPPERALKRVGPDSEERPGNANAGTVNGVDTESTRQPQAQD